MSRRYFPHDMGGQDDGPVIPDHGQEPVFKTDWHARALAITVLSGAHGKWNLDESRHIRETLPDDDYTTFSYYEKWMSGLANLLVRHGLVSADELAAGTAEPQDLQEKSLRADQVKPVMDKGGPSGRKVSLPPKFEVGQIVTTTTPDDTACVKNGHTRLPHYASQAAGIVLAHHGGHVLPDSNAHHWQTGAGEAPEHLYAVRFKAADLWPDDDRIDPRDHVVVDCWESYLR